MTDAPDPTAPAGRAPDAATAEPTGAVCWLAATCTACGALIEGGTCWNCGAHRDEEWAASGEAWRPDTTMED
jgi:hypothetical protein